MSAVLTHKARAQAMLAPAEFLTATALGWRNAVANVARKADEPHQAKRAAFAPRGARGQSGRTT